MSVFDHSVGLALKGLISRSKKNLSLVIHYHHWNQRTILGKTFADFFTFSTVSFHHKWNGTRLSSPESECTSCLRSFRMASDLGYQEIRKFQENPWNTWIWSWVARRPPKIANFDISAKKSCNVRCETFHRKTYFT